MTTTANILSRLGKKTTANQNHVAPEPGDKKDPNTPLEDFTKQGGIDSDAHRPLDKGGNQEPIDTSKGEAGVDDSTDKQDYSKEYEGIAKGKGSVEASAVIGKKLKEGIELKVNLDDMKNLLESQEQDEKFVTDALEIFESVMLDVLNTQVDEMVASATELVENIIEEEVTALEEQVNEYLNVAITEWAEDNKLAVESSIRTNLAESFMSDLTDLMESYNINLPEESIDLYEHSCEIGEQLMNENEELEAENSRLNEELQSLNKAIYIEAFISDKKLNLVEGEKLRKLAKELEFINEGDLINKLNTISENYVKQNAVPLSESQTEKHKNLVEDFMEEAEEAPITKSLDPTVAMLAKKFTK